MGSTRSLSPVAHPKINISVSLPTFDGTKRKTATFVMEFREIIEQQGFQESDWNGLVRMQCLKIDALKHLKTPL